MKSLVVLVAFLWTIACASLTERSSDKYGFLGFELLEDKLDNMEKRLSQLLVNLASTEDKCEQKINALKEVITAENSRVLSSLEHLLSNANKNHIEAKKLYDELKTDHSKHLDRITKLEKNDESTMQKLESMEPSIMGKVSTLADETKQILAGQQINSCHEVIQSGLYELRTSRKIVYCEMNSFDGGWLVIQQRVCRTLNFTRNWTEYRDGFGSVGKDSDYWLGLQTVHVITNSGKYELAIEMKNEKGELGYARYSSFRLAGEDDRYKLDVDGYSGTVGDSLINHNGVEFFTIDKDNGYKCAEKFLGGWWYTNNAYICFDSNLNLQQHNLFWRSWTIHGQYSRMMIRRR